MIEDDRCGFCLMQSTLGDAALVTGASTPRLLKEMKTAMAAEVTQQKDEEIQRQQAEFERRLLAEKEERRTAVEAAERRAAVAAEQLSDASQIVLTTQQRAAELERRLAATEERQRLEMEGRVVTAFRRSRYAEWLAYAIVFAPIAIALYLLGDLAGKLERWEWLGGLVLFFILGLTQFAVFPNVFLAGLHVRYDFVPFIAVLVGLG
jgi:hypothetical protein